MHIYLPVVLRAMCLIVKHMLLVQRQQGLGVWRSRVWLHGGELSFWVYGRGVCYLGHLVGLRKACIVLGVRWLDASEDTVVAEYHCR
jgi:hypothetical protein